MGLFGFDCGESMRCRRHNASQGYREPMLHQPNQPIRLQYSHQIKLLLNKLIDECLNVGALLKFCHTIIIKSNSTSSENINQK